MVSMFTLSNGLGAFTPKCILGAFPPIFKLGGFSPRLRRVRRSTAFVLEQSLQHADRGVERRARRSLRRLAVPAAIGQLLGEQPSHDASDLLAEIGTNGHEQGPPPGALARSQDPDRDPAAA
jgi:hypothetical protein